jgi:hypothetical protein
MRETDGPCLSESDDVHPENDLGLTRVVYAEMSLKGALFCRLDILEIVGDDANVVHIHRNDICAMHEMVHGLEVDVICRLSPRE